MMCVDVVFICFALMHGIAFAVLADDYRWFENGAFVACSVKFSLNWAKLSFGSNELKLNACFKMGK